MTRGKYLNHITLTTGDIRRSYRDEVSDDIVSKCRDLLASALRGATPIPNVEPACTMQATGTAKGLLVTVYGPERAPLLTMAVARHSQAGSKLWRMMIETATTPIVPLDCPPEPWCAARLEIGITRHMAASHWLGDFERVLAWTWLDGKAA